MWHRWGLVLVGLLSGFALPFGLSAESRTQLAPADEYFGRARMSPLEITNRIGDAERRGASYRGLMTTQAAIEDWTRKYPGDPWIPQREYRMSRLFARLHSRDGNAEATRCRAFLRAHFPGARYAVAAQREGSAKIAQAPAGASSKRTAPKKAVKKKHRFLGIF
jgi:hypothetical protein